MAFTRSFLGFALVSMMAIGTLFFSFVTITLSEVMPLSTPTPVPKSSEADKKPAVGPISSVAASFGISPRVDQLPVAKPTVEGEPREINPQNTIPVKSVKPTVTKSKSSRKQALKKRGGR